MSFVKKYGLVIGSVLAMCTAYSAIKEDKPVHHLNNSKQELVRLATDSSNTPPQASNEYSTKAANDLAKLLPIIKHVSEFSKTMFSEINTACTNLDNILEPAYVCEHENIVHAKGLVAGYINILDNYEKKYNEELTLAESQIQEIVSEHILKRGVLKRTAETKQMLSETVTYYLHSARESAGQVNDILNFLSEKSGTFWESDGLLTFEKAEDDFLYNLLRKKLAEHSKTRATIIENLQAHMRSSIQKPENFDKNEK